MLTKGLTRRAAVGLIGLSLKGERRVPGDFVFESQQRGHQLRDHARQLPPKRTVRIPIVIAGGGMAGLCAAWWLDRQGVKDFTVLEMEAQPGGNSRYGENEISAYPWGAHYIPVPNPESVLVRELLTEFGALQNGEWRERFLCHSPQERLYINGRWQDGIEPELALAPKDRAEFHRFGQRMAEFRASGCFTIPAAAGQRDPWQLDRTNFRSWLLSQGFQSPYLHWYADYACRDDYGASAGSTSAWAGVHYFASRAHEEKEPLTWPEGNGWVLRKLLEHIGGYVRSSALVYRIARVRNRWHVYTPETLYDCGSVLFAAPSFLAPYVIEGYPRVDGFTYSPWLTANLTLASLPDECAWDNVIYNSPALGYVDATHQSLASRRDRAVWTYYYSLAEMPAADARRHLLAHDHAWWCDAILTDLEKVHRDIRKRVTRIDIFRNGHAMIRPEPGFLGNASRAALRQGLPGLYFANSDVTGFSIFEEAQYRGVQAASRALRH